VADLSDAADAQTAEWYAAPRPSPSPARLRAQAAESEPATVLLRQLVDLIRESGFG
jgi:hypothetical protein